MRTMVSITPANKRSSLAALLYDDVKVWEQWESDSHVAIIWSRESDFLTEYQRDRLMSDWIPSFDMFNGGLTVLVERMGLNIPCS